MSLRRFLSATLDQRGVALPVAMLALLILTSLIIGFVVLSSTEPTIASNQMQVAQARAVAEAGVERAILGLNQGSDPATAGASSAIPVTFTTAPSPYDGSQLVQVLNGTTQIGGFRVTVTNGATIYERRITSVGWVPNDTTTGPKTVQKITVTVFNPQFILKDPPAALSVRGELEMGGNSLVDSRQDTTCGRKMGTLTTGDTHLQSGATDIWGAGSSETDPGLGVRNVTYDAHGGAIPTNGADIVENVATTLPDGTPGQGFDSFIWTDADIDTLRAYAKANGTYLQGNQSFSSSNRLPNGFIFIDTVSGTNITQENVTPPTPTSDFANVEIHGNAGSGPGGVFNGWIFVNGNLAIDGDFLTTGFIYSQNDISYHGTGTGLLTGAMVSRNIRDSSSTTVDSDLLGNALIVYNCEAAKTGGGQILSRWMMKSGTYKEVSGS